MKLEDIINKELVIDLKTLKTDEELVKQIQMQLGTLLLYPGTRIDGKYGKRTETALVEFCNALHLNNIATGKFGKTFSDKVLNVKELPQNKFLSDADYERAAEFLGVEVAAIRAVVEVETNGSGFLDDGRPKILFERHIFWDLTPVPVSQTRPDLSNPVRGGYSNSEAGEWERLNDAIKFDRKAALQSASWGLGQVMGFNHEIAGYSDVEVFVKAMYQSEGKQLDAMMNFIKKNDLDSALRRHDWATFAGGYNGSAGVGVYDLKLESAYEQHAASESAQTNGSAKVTQSFEEIQAVSKMATQSVSTTATQADSTTATQTVSKTATQTDSMTATQVVSTTLQDVTGDDTSILKGLDQQLIDEMNRIKPDCLVSFADLNVDMGASVHPFLQQPAKEALNRAISDRGEKLSVNSAYRTIAQQLVLWNDRANNPNLVAQPGGSNHQSGKAIDVNDYEGWMSSLENNGWQWLGPRDEVHFDYEGGDTQDLGSTAVLAFQRLWNRHNPNDRILEDGEYGPTTEERLNKSPIDGFGATASPSAAKSKLRNLRVSNPPMQGEDVRKVQEALVKAKISVNVDGIFSATTESAVKQFQQQKRLSADGVVGPGTRSVLGL